MDDFEPTFKKFLTNYGIEDECKDVLKGFHIRDYPSLVKNQSNLRRFAERDANISLPSRDFPYTSKVLLSLVDYVSRFVTISPDEVLREIILKGPDFLNFLATGSSELASSYRIETKWKQEISGEVDDGKQWTSSQVDEIENDINLTNDELAALREFIRGKKWEYDLDNNTFYLPFEGQSKGFSLPARFFKILFDYQRDGIEWLLSGYSMKKNEVSGAIIADDMGLGKSIQSLAAIGMLMRGGVIKNALIISPKTVAYNWKKEANKWLPKINVANLQIDLVTSDTKPNDKRKILRAALGASRNERSNIMGHIVIVPFSVISRHVETFISKTKGCRWGLIVIDEAHQVKNPSTAQSKACKRLCTTRADHTLLLTGTPIPNRLMELFNLVNMYISKKILGTERSFKENFVRPIESAHENAPQSVKRKGAECSKDLQEITEGFLLRRTKREKLDLPPKSVSVLWYNIGQLQRQKYKEKDFVSTTIQDSTELNTTKQNVLVETEPQKKNSGKDFLLALQFLTRVRMLCAHPLLVDNHNVKVLNEIVNRRGVQRLVKDSPKMGIVLELVERFRKDGHHTIICSQYTSTLDLVDFILRKSGFKISRIDGKVKGDKRMLVANDFNKGKYDVMLLSTKAGGVGIDLVGADRVIIFDPDWTPANDKQAMDRAHRPGQKRKVEVYYLIAAGTIEEKMLEIQMHKDGIHNSVMASDSRMKRLYEKHDPSELFELSPVGQSKVFQNLQSKGQTWTKEVVQSFVRHNHVLGISKSQI